MTDAQHDSPPESHEQENFYKMLQKLASKPTRLILLAIILLFATNAIFGALNQRRGHFLSFASDDQDELAQRDAAFMKRIAADSLIAAGDDPSVKVSWSDVVGQEEAKQALKRSVVWPLQNPALFSGLRAPAPAILLYGPPGTGKTMLAKACAAALADHHVAFFNVTASTFAAKYHGDGERLVRCLFKAAREAERAVIFIDEIDALLSSRSGTGGGEDDASRRLKTEFLVNLDGLVSDHGSRVILIAATNMPHLLDPAFLRRCGRRVNVALPTAAARLLQLQSLLKRESTNVTVTQLEWFAKDQLKGYSGSDVAAVVREAALAALDEAIDKQPAITKITVSDIPPLSLDHLQVAKARVKPSLSSGYLKDIEHWERSML